MKTVREICVTKKVIDVVVKGSSGNHKDKRAKRTNITAEKVAKNNERLSWRKLNNILNANCDKSWWHMTMTHRVAPNEKGAERELKNCFRRISRELKKSGKEFKWIVVTEYENARIHHHVITNADLDIVRDKWKSGIVLARPLDDGPNYIRLAVYLIKETRKTFRNKNVNKMRYSHSRNLIIPEVKVETVSSRLLFSEPKAWKGYFIDKETVRRYVHPITGLEHLEYTMISLDENPRVKKYYNGKKKKRENFKKYINSVEEQLSLLDGLA
ncbi:MAG: hypothetical protein RSE61_05710 [Anaerovoracaceae bacterium]